MKYIANLEDIAPLATQITLRGGKLAVIVNALSLDQLGALIYRHAALKDALASGAQGVGLYEAILGGGKALVQDLVDAATGIQGLGGRLSATEQGRIILSCVELTTPSDDEEVNDFLDQVTAFAVRAKQLVKAAKAKGLASKA